MIYQRIYFEVRKIRLQCGGLVLDWKGVPLGKESNLPPIDDATYCISTRYDQLLFGIELLQEVGIFLAVSDLSCAWC